MSGPMRRPTRISGLLAVVAALAAVWLVGDAQAQQLALAADVAAIAVLALGVSLRQRGYRVVGVGISLVGFVGILGAVAVTVALPSKLMLRVETAPGLLGAGLVACGVLPLWARLDRRFVSAGAGLIVLSVAFSGVIHGAYMMRLLGSFALAIVAWDAGEQAINLGEQLGSEARTWPVEVGHSGATAAYGGLAVGAAVGFHDLDVTGVPLAGLLLLVVAALVLLVTLYN